MFGCAQVLSSSTEEQWNTSAPTTAPQPSSPLLPHQSQLLQRYSETERTELRLHPNASNLSVSNSEHLLDPPHERRPEELTGDSARIASHPPAVADGISEHRSTVRIDDGVARRTHLACQNDQEGLHSNGNQMSARCFDHNLPTGRRPFQDVLVNERSNSMEVPSAIEDGKVRKYQCTLPTHHAREDDVDELMHLDEPDGGEGTLVFAPLLGTFTKRRRIV